jgi:hypothetical protein
LATCAFAAPAGEDGLPSDAADDPFFQQEEDPFNDPFFKVRPSRAELSRAELRPS